MDLDNTTFPPRAKASMFKHDMKPVVVERKERKADKATLLRKAYEEVDRRDKKKCVVTGRKLTADHADAWQRLTRDHLAPRSTAPERINDVDNIITVADALHVLLQRSQLIPVDKAGNETTSVSKIAGYRWSERVKTPPFRLGRKEWKAERNR